MVSRSTGESPVLRACLDLLEVRGVFAWRVNTAGIYDPTRGCHRSFVGLKGVSDILGLLPPHGRFLAVETKRPAIPAIGQPAGRLSADQRHFLGRVAMLGGVGVCVGDVRTLECVLDILERDPTRNFTIDGHAKGYGE